MTRRIVPALLAFLAAVLIAAVIPLAMRAVSHDRSAFVEDATATGRSVGAVAEEELADGKADPELSIVLDASWRGGDRVLIADGGGRVVDSRGSAPARWREFVAASHGQAGPVTTVTPAAVLVVVPIRDGGATTGPVDGTVLLSRSTASLTGEIRSLWLSLAAIAAIALGCAALLATGFARWVSRPLAQLDGVALRLANGDLSVRPAGTSGPPEVRRLAGSVAIMASRLDGLIQGHRAMLADVSHQLRTPLAALRLRVDLLAADAADGKQGVAEELGGVQEEIARLSHLLDGLLAVARAEAVTERREPVDVATVAAERVAAWLPVAAERSVGLAIAAGPGEALASLVPGHLEQVLDNLLDNALDALGRTATADPRVWVRVSTGTSLRVEVADNGPGMTGAERERAFSRFATGSPGGTGIGLAIVARLTSASGGTARLAETPGGGLTVVLEFPVR